MDAYKTDLIEREKIWDRYLSIFKGITKEEQNCKWRKGDIALEVEVIHGEGSLKKFARDVGCSQSYIERLRKTSATFKKPQRCGYLSWMHHYICSKTDDPHGWLAKAHKNGWSTRELEEAIKAATQEHKTVHELMCADGERLKKAAKKFLVNWCSKERDDADRNYMSNIFVVIADEFAYAEKHGFTKTLDPDGFIASTRLSRIAT